MWGASMNEKQKLREELWKDLHFGALVIPERRVFEQRGARTDPAPLRDIQDETVRRLEEAVRQQQAAG